MDKTYTLKARSVTRPLVLLPALVVGLSLAFTGAASAQTAVPFQASVNAIQQKGQPSAPCPTTYCASASIAGYGAATWMEDTTSETPVSSACFAYTGTSTFTLLSDGSTLVLNENGLACDPGNSGNTPGWQQAYGHPFYANGSWTVQSATGQFGGLTGNGTDTLSDHGAPLDVAWSGTLLTGTSQ